MKGGGERAKSAGGQGWGCDWSQKRFLVPQNGGEALAAACSQAELCWGRVCGYPRRRGGMKWSGALESTSRRLQDLLPPEEKKEKRKKEKRSDFSST